jgi:RNA polymerase sigma-70 factor (ECF subfamily)
VHDLGEPVTEAVFVEPYPDGDLRVADEETSPEARYDRLESVELAFVAALQELPATQRAVLLLRDVLALPAAEVADVLDTSVASVNSALQRARQNVEDRVGTGSQQTALRTLGDAGQKQLLDAFIRAWEQQDIDALVALLAEDVRLAMPPLPAWFDGREAVGRFFAERVFERAWKVVPITANGQLALAGYMSDPSRTSFPLSIVDVLSVRDGRIASLDAFNDPEAFASFDLPAEAPH